MSPDRSAPIDLAREADLRLGSALVRPAFSEVVVAGQTIRLQPRVMQVLVALARADGEVVSRDELLASCWAGLAIGDDAINRCIGRLRRLSEEEAPGAFTIGTLPRIGYRLSRGADQASPPPAQAAVRKLSICVLPFANMSDDPEQEYFSDGISEDIITDLSKVSALVGGRPQHRLHLQGQERRTCRRWRAQLGVSHVLEGSVRKAGGRVRITAQLIDGAAGDHIWAERYDRDLTDIFALQDEISEAIVDGAEAEAAAGREEGDRAARHRQRRGLRPLSDGPLILSDRQRRRSAARRGDRAPHPPGRGDRSRLRPGLGSAGRRRNTPFTATMGGPATAARPPWTAPWPSTPIWPRPAR